ncbi:MAG: sensor hybrid histidine kinase, partial [Caulobacteraceae bacterium]|nr:sensor hybrid histidine kinase [Caulobacteraceae bacterium]
WRVEADPNELEASILNLAVNARDAMNGEGELLIRARIVDGMPPIRSEPPREGEFIAVSMQDTGCGIDPEKLEAIFEPFYTTKAVGKGTGLGLSQAFGFAKQSGGEIEVVSQPGQGSTFTLYLPRVHDSVPPGAPFLSPARDQVGATGAGVCVLVVEDNEAVGQFSTEMLHDLGYKTRWVANAADALEVLAEDASAFELVFSDVVMPGMNGVELSRVVRQRYPQIPVVLTSGYGDVLVDEGFEGVRLIRKPYSVEALAVVLKQARDEVGG